MGIKGLTDRAASFPQIGILRKGAPKPERGPGRDLKYFRFDTDDAAAASAFRTVYGDEPTSVRVYLPFAGAAENFEAWQEHWTAGALQHRCDGETCVLWLQGQRYSTQAAPCPHRALSKDERDRCKPTGRLKVVIPELRRLAYVTVLTGSIHDIIALTEQLAALEQLRGDLRGIPLILRRTPREISMPSSNGKRTRVEKWMISIEAAPSWVDLQLQAQERAALPSGAPARPLLPAPAADTSSGEVWPDDEAEDEPEPTRATREQLTELRDLWRQSADLGRPAPARHLTLDLETLSSEQIAKLTDQARGWIAQAQQAPAEAAPAAA
jgi:hypothetical protein